MSLANSISRDNTSCVASEDFHDLHKYSVDDWTFWQDLWEYLGIVYSVPPGKVRSYEYASQWTCLSATDIHQILESGRLPEVPVWFPGARLNYAENVLSRNDDAIACTAARETGQISHHTYRELRVMVKEMAAAMRTNGLQIGDRVAGQFCQALHRVHTYVFGYES